MLGGGSIAEAVRQAVGDGPASAPDAPLARWDGLSSWAADTAAGHLSADLGLAATTAGLEGRVRAAYGLTDHIRAEAEGYAQHGSQGWDAGVMAGLSGSW